MEAKAEAKELPRKQLSNQKHSEQIELSLEVGSQDETTPSVGGTVQQAKQASGGNFEAKKVLTQGELAKRLSVHSASIGRYRKKGNLAEWSAKKDPDQKGWTYLEEKRGFVPVES